MGKLNILSSKELQARMVELKYADSKFSFVLVLPDRKSNLQQLESKIKSVNLADIFNKMHPFDHTLYIPKFKVEYEIELNDVLQKVRRV